MYFLGIASSVVSYSVVLDQRALDCVIKIESVKLKVVIIFVE